jgi:hypothetical protein
MAVESDINMYDVIPRNANPWIWMEAADTADWRTKEAWRLKADTRLPGQQRDAVDASLAVYAQLKQGIDAKASTWVYRTLNKLSKVIGNPGGIMNSAIPNLYNSFRKLDAYHSWDAKASYEENRDIYHAPQDPNDPNAVKEYYKTEYQKYKEFKSRISKNSWKERIINNRATQGKATCYMEGRGMLTRSNPNNRPTKPICNKDGTPWA